MRRRKMREIMWNPGKELKVRERRAADSKRRGRWNPGKELKARLPRDGIRVLQPAWNPGKELKAAHSGRRCIE